MLDEHGWFDTGDLGWIVPKIKFGPARACSGTLVLDGRVKDTIVLLTGTSHTISFTCNICYDLSLKGSQELQYDLNSFFECLVSSDIYLVVFNDFHKKTPLSLRVG